MSRNKPLRVAAVVGHFPTLSETFLYTTFQNLLSAGVEVHILARRRGQSPHHVALSVTYLPPEDAPFPIKLLVLLAVLGRLIFRSPDQALRLLRHFNSRRQQRRWSWRQTLWVMHRVLPLMVADADLIYFAHGSLAVTYREVFGLRPAYLSLRGSDINIEPLMNPEYASGLAEVLGLAEGIHCVSEAIKSKAETLIGSPLPHAKVIYTALNPLFLDDKSPLPAMQMPLSDAVTLLSVGRLDWRKGYEHGLMAIRYLLDQGVRCRWLIAGEGEYRIPIEYAIRDLGLSDHVSLLGGVSQKAIQDYLYEADIFFHPAVQEGLSNAVLEAMALGLPVVCTQVGGMEEAIQHGNTGLLVAARDWRGMGDAIRRLAETPDLRQQLGVAAREDVRMRFTAANQQQGFIEFFTGSENSF